MVVVVVVVVMAMVTVVVLAIIVVVLVVVIGGGGRVRRVYTDDEGLLMTRASAGDGDLERGSGAGFYAGSRVF